LNNRYYSLDVFRGATVALMILVNNPGSWSYIYRPLKHADWHGWTPTDLVFPFFLFAVGNAMAFVMPRFLESGPQVFWSKVIKRAFLIFLIGLLLNWSPFVRWEDGQLVPRSFSTLRIMGVLQRIAICYFFASLLAYYLKPKNLFAVSILLLLLYWGLCAFLGNPADPYALEGFWGTAFDRNLLGENHLYKGEGVPFDPEGLASTLPAIVQVTAGYLAGNYIRRHSKQQGFLPPLFCAGIILTIAGLFWGQAFPINKKIWTSSYVVLTSGLAILVLALMILLIEKKQIRNGLTRFFDVFGKNPLFIFVLSGFLPRVLGLIRIPIGINEIGIQQYTSPFGWFYRELCAKFPGPPENGSLLYALIMIGFYWLIGYWMDRKRIYVKV